MRIIAGEARGIPLVAPKGSSTRPTSDRAKEGLFNIIGSSIKGSIFLDLFSGSGGIGIEAISRGAIACVFVDSSRSATIAIKENLRKAKLSDRAEVLEVTAKNAINILRNRLEPFNYVFLDPPYEGGQVGETVKALASSGILSIDCSVIIETGARSPLPDIREDFETIEDRKYGQSRFVFLKRGSG